MVYLESLTFMVIVWVFQEMMGARAKKATSEP